MNQIKRNTHQSKNNKHISSIKSQSNKIKDIKAYKSIEKTLKFKNPNYLQKLAKHGNYFSNQKVLSSKSLKNIEISDWNTKLKKSISPNPDKKTNSDQQSTKANGLLESCQMYKNFKQKEIHNPSYVSKPESKSAKQQINNEAEKLKQSLKTRINELKMMQKVHDEQIKDLKNRLSAEETRRLQKMQSIQKLKFHNKILSLQKSFKQKDELKYSYQLQMKKK